MRMRGRPQLPILAERLSIFMQREWTYTRALKYLEGLTHQERRELFEDIERESTQEGRDKITQKEAPGLVPLKGAPEGMGACSKCGSARGRALYDKSNPTFVVWVCRRCYEQPAVATTSGVIRERVKSPV